MADIPGNTSTRAVITGTGTFRSSLETSGDSDWWRVNLVAGLTYDFRLSGDGSANSLDDSRFAILDSAGNTLDYSFAYNGGSHLLSITAATNGPYYISVGDGNSDSQAEGNYIIQARMNDKLPNNNSTTAVLKNVTTAGSLETSGDADRYKVHLVAGQRAEFILNGDGSANSLDDASFALLDQHGNQLDTSITYSGGPISIAATAKYTGTYYVVVADGNSDSQAEGNFIITSRTADRIVNNNTTTAVIRDGQSMTSRIDAADDADWVRFAASAGTTYAFTLSGTGSASSLGSKELVLRDAAGNSIDYESTYGTGPVTLTWKAATTGPVYLDLHSANDSSNIGDYRLSVVSDTPVLRGTAGNDVLTAGWNNNRVLGFEGNDQLAGGNGDDVLVGGAGNDTMWGGAGRDTAEYGGNTPVRVNLSLTGPQNTGLGMDKLIGIENLTGGNGSDVLTGNWDANILRGGAGNDTLIGLNGNDTLVGGAGNDRLDGGAGVDMAVFNTGAAMTVNLSTGRATGEGNDILIGIESAQTGGGADRLIGNAADNRLIGGAGNDTIAGGVGKDVLTGGAGADHFVFGDAQNYNRITDFQDGVDRVVIGGITSSFADLTLTSANGGTVVSWGMGTSVMLHGIQAAQLSGSDFIFV